MSISEYTNPLFLSGDGVPDLMRSRFVGKSSVVGRRKVQSRNKTSVDPYSRLLDFLSEGPRYKPIKNSSDTTIPSEISPGVARRG